MENTPPNISAHRESEPASSTEATRGPDARRAHHRLCQHLVDIPTIVLPSPSCIVRSGSNNGRAPLYMRGAMAISTAAILLKGKSVLSRNRQWLKVALAATAMGLIGRRRVGLLQRSRSCAPSSFCRGLLHSDGCFQHSFPLPVVGRAHSLCLPDKLRLGGFLLLLCRFPCTGGDSACGKLAAWHFADSVLLPHLASAVGAFGSCQHH